MMIKQMPKIRFIIKLCISLLLVIGSFFCYTNNSQKPLSNIAIINQETVQAKDLGTTNFDVPNAPTAGQDLNKVQRNTQVKQKDGSTHPFSWYANVLLNGENGDGYGMIGLVRYLAVFVLVFILGILTYSAVKIAKLKSIGASGILSEMSGYLISIIASLIFLGSIMTLSGAFLNF